ncbi:Hsp20/alpha crystallin family protein [archaeon]|jgi:HSP20 family protein|nr:Hsp20/alpha crystallin family protein [archaeon]MBT6823961.1 Hsp20/alpha crystallin family protein [archaeon]MBT7107191.1 Hsp20/alpha crystallin family protein [archaeon]MBT7297739.1 Hsp20/alpha crystallin family protein [archaeon]
MKREIWDPLKDMKEFRKEMNDIFKIYWKEGMTLPKGIKIREPLIDIIDKKKDLIVIFELPGIDKNDLNLIIDPDRVEIKAKKKVEKVGRNENYFRKERSYGGFYKVFSLPVYVNPDKTKVDFNKGVLTLKLSKLKKQPKKKIINLSEK